MWVCSMDGFVISRIGFGFVNRRFCVFVYVCRVESNKPLVALYILYIVYMLLLYVGVTLIRAQRPPRSCDT